MIFLDMLSDSGLRRFFENWFKKRAESNGASDREAVSIFFEC